jgi:hypothetical protein
VNVQVHLPFAEQLHRVDISHIVNHNRRTDCLNHVSILTLHCCRNHTFCNASKHHLMSHTTWRVKIC